MPPGPSSVCSMLNAQFSSVHRAQHQLVWTLAYVAYERRLCVTTMSQCETKVYAFVVPVLVCILSCLSSPTSNPPPLTPSYTGTRVHTHGFVVDSTSKIYCARLHFSVTKFVSWIFQSGTLQVASYKLTCIASRAFSDKKRRFPVNKVMGNDGQKGARLDVHGALVRNLRLQASNLIGRFVNRYQ